MYVRSKNIKGHTYYYLVEGHRVGGKVKQKVIKYLGKGGWGSIEPTRFVGVGAGANINDTKTVAKLRNKITHGCKALDCAVTYNLRRKSAAGVFSFIQEPAKAGGEPTYRNRQIRVRKDAAFSTLCHEFGHLIDYELRERGISFAGEAGSLEGIELEMEAVGRDKYPRAYISVSEWTEAGLRNTEPGERAFIRGNQKLIQYVETFDETFANVFALCLTDPAKAERLAPKTTKLIMEIVQRDPKVRDVLTKLEVWELGTTEAKSGET